MASSRRDEVDDPDDESRAGREEREHPTRHSTINLMIQIVDLVRAIIDRLGR